MARQQKKPAPARAPSSYELLGQRIQKVINSTASQTSKKATISRLPEERQDDWERLLEEIAEADNVTVTKQGEGAAAISWTVLDLD